VAVLEAGELQWMTNIAVRDILHFSVFLAVVGVHILLGLACIITDVAAMLR